MERCTASAAGGTSQRLKSAGATVFALSKKDMGTDAYGKLIKKRPSEKHEKHFLDGLILTKFNAGQDEIS